MRRGASSLTDASDGCLPMRSSMSSVGDVLRGALALAFVAFGDLSPFTRFGDGAFAGGTAMATR